MSEQRYEPRLFDVDQPASVVVGLPSRVALDAYHKLLRASWPVTLSAIAGTFLLANLLFALAFVWAGGVANVRPGSVLDAFFFSVQTMGTVGYGDMRPVTPLAQWLVVAEVMIGILLLAVATGLVFAKISRPTARLLFSRFAVIAPMDGVPTLMFRVANARNNLVVAVNLQAVLLRTEKTAEGQVIYRMHDLPLVRSRVPTMTRTHLAMHRIEPGGLLHGATPQSIAEQEVQLVVALTGIDSTTSQTIYGGHDYLTAEIRFGWRFADMLSELPDGRLLVDFSRFDELVPAA
jgi:inward rectifier potassium channel